MSLLILIPFSIIGAFLIRYLCQAIPAQMYWEEENWLLEKLGRDISHSPSPLSQWKKYIRLDRLLIACFIICFTLAIYLHNHVSNDLRMLLLLFLTFGLTLLAITDIIYRFLPDVITISLLWIGLAMQLGTTSQIIPLQSAVIGAISGYLLLWIPAQIYYLMRKHHGVGYGDMKLLAAIGAWLGWQSLLPILLLASILAILSQIPALLKQTSTLRTTIPFGPFIVIACLLNLPSYFAI